MLVRHERLVQILSLRRNLHRPQYSTKPTANYENFKKLRAYPFRLTPEEAQKKMADFSRPFCDDLGLLATLWQAVTTSVSAVPPLRFSAAYFPAWIVNAEIEADLTLGDTRRRGTVMFRDCYIPGSHVPTLSTAPLWDDDLALQEPLPCIIRQSQLGDHVQRDTSEDESHLFDPSLLRPYGQEVQCIPFTTSPFSLLEIARSLPWNHAIMDENFKFAPSSMKVRLFSAYPVLLPLYIAMYEVKRDEAPPGTTLTMWTLAHTDLNWTNVMIDNIALKFRDKRKDNSILKFFEFFNDVSPDSEVFPIVRPSSQANIEMMSPKGTTYGLEAWLGKTLRSSANISRLAGTLDDDDDPRIRPMTETEKVGLERYIENEKEILLLKRIMEDLKMTSTVDRPHSPSPATASSLQARLDFLLTKKEELMPQWWTEWESLRSREDPYYPS